MKLLVNLELYLKDDIKKLWENCRIDVNRMLELEKEMKHDVVAFTRALSEYLGEEKKWVHYGLTSTDVVDTAYGYILKQANEIIIRDIEEILEVLSRRAIEYKGFLV